MTSRFFKRDGKFFVTTDAPDGDLDDFEIGYTFGVYPLQQYLIALPDGRIQALGTAWDARPADQGGQRWFHFYPDEPPQAGDPLHWTGIDQTWNFCAPSATRPSCARTTMTTTRMPPAGPRLTSAARPATVPARPTSHGRNSSRAGCPGAKTATTVSRFTSTSAGTFFWTIDPATGNPERSVPRTSAKELATCGICHSRGAKIAEGWRPGQQLLETHVPSLLGPGLFEADGKMVDEVYNYASFRKSKMFKQGVSCSDCHDPHSLELRADGNGVCHQCHDAAKYDAAAHHHHAEGSLAASCPACHMPERTYIVIDPRHDHGFRVPRPDVSQRFDVSNACNDCHSDRKPAWAAAAIEDWFGPERKGFQTWTEALAAVRDDTGRPGRRCSSLPARQRRRGSCAPRRSMLSPATPAASRWKRHGAISTPPTRW